MFCVELPSDNSRSGKKTKDKVTGKKGKHSIHVNKSLDERKKKNTHPGYYMAMYIGKVVYVLYLQIG